MRVGFVASVLIVFLNCSLTLAVPRNWSLLNYQTDASTTHHVSFVQKAASTLDSTNLTDSSAAKLPSPRTAEKRSLLYTLIPLPTLVLTVPALVAGPSAGYFYAGLNGRAWSGIGIRTLALGGMFSAFGICGWDCGPGDDSYTIAWAVFIGSGAILAGSAIYDIATVKPVTVHNNEKRREVVVTLYPEYFQKLEAFGLTILHRF